MEGSTPARPEAEADGGVLTVVVALAANGLIAVAKTIAAALSGSASMTAEAAHSWADTGNEAFLLLAERRGGRPPDREHPRGHGRETYVWAMFAAVGLLVAGGALSVWHGVGELGSASHDRSGFTLNWIVLAVAFVLEGSSFLQAIRQARRQGRRFGLPPVRFVLRTSDATLRAVVLEDSAALVGLLLAGAGVGLHQWTGDPVWDALGSVAVGLLLGFVAVVLIVRNHDFLVGEVIPESLWNETLEVLLRHESVDRVTYLHIEYVGPMRFFVVAAVDLVGDDPESAVAERLRALEGDIERHSLVADAVLTLSTSAEASLHPPG